MIYTKYKSKLLSSIEFMVNIHKQNKSTLNVNNEMSTSHVLFVTSYYPL